MQLSKTEILTLEQIAKGNRDIKSIALALNIKERRVYEIMSNLAQKDFIERIGGIIKAKELLHVRLFLQLLDNFPNIASVISDSGIPIFSELLNSLTIQEISQRTGFKKSTVYNKLKAASRRSMINKNNNKFKLNEKIWSKLAEFLRELKKYELIIDNRIPASAIIYYKKDEEIIFSSREKVDAIETAFSIYKKYGINILTARNYYYLPKKKLTKNEILKHSLCIVEKEKDVRSFIYIALFYVKYKKEFRIKHKILSNLDVVLSKGVVNGYPTYQEIKDRAEIYGIEV